MGNCIYCNEPVGLLRKEHKECAEKNQQGKNQILKLVKTTYKEDKDLTTFKSDIAAIARKSLIKEKEIPTIVYNCWLKAMDMAFEDGILSVEEENKLTAIINQSGMSKDEIKKSPGVMKLVKGAVLRDVMNGIIPDRFEIPNLPINLQKDESVVWVFTPIQYMEEQKVTHYVGGSSGVSVRIMKGVYYRQSAFKGKPVHSNEMIHEDSGLIVATNKHIYFHGSRKSFRIKYDKIVSFQPFSDALGIMQDSKNAKLQVFKVNDGWFIYNLVSNLAKM